MILRLCGWILTYWNLLHNLYIYTIMYIYIYILFENQSFVTKIYRHIHLILYTAVWYRSAFSVWHVNTSRLSQWSLAYVPRRLPGDEFPMGIPEPHPACQVDMTRTDAWIPPHWQADVGFHGSWVMVSYGKFVRYHHVWSFCVHLVTHVHMFQLFLTVLVGSPTHKLRHQFSRAQILPSRIGGWGKCK